MIHTTTTPVDETVLDWLVVQPALAVDEHLMGEDVF